MCACLAFDTIHPYAQHTLCAKTEGVVQKHLAAGAGLRGHVYALLAQERRALVARVHTLKTLRGAAIVACCAALAADVSRALVALRGTTQGAIARRGGNVHFKRDKERENHFFLLGGNRNSFFDDGAECGGPRTDPPL